MKMPTTIISVAAVSAFSSIIVAHAFMGTSLRAATTLRSCSSAAAGRKLLGLATAPYGSTDQTRGNLSRLLCSNTIRTSSSIEADVKVGVSNLEILQTMLSEHGAPGSAGCKKPNLDLQPIKLDTTSSESAATENEEDSSSSYLNLHPHLFPIAKSQTTGNYICALHRAIAGDVVQQQQQAWPIVETTSGGLGYKLLALNSDHLMQRIICECDSDSQSSERSTSLIDLYNDNISKAGTKYEVGSVAKLGYGVDKYVLLKVGPFADIYESLANGHATKGDESSALISAEAANNKITGFASTFLFYATLLNSFSNRDEESRDAARMCLRMPLPSIGYAMEDFRMVATLAQVADDSDPDEVVLAKLQSMYEKMKEHEKDDPQASSLSGGNDMTPEQKAIDDANYLLDATALTGADWKTIRPRLAEVYKSVGRDDMADFVNPSSSNL